MRRRRPKQLELPTWGGKRKNAGRPRRGPDTLPHVAREVFSRRTPLHVTLRMAPHVYNLRSRRSGRCIQAALRGGAERPDVRVVDISVQGNHVHLLVEADDQRALRSAITGLSIRMAHRLNRMMGRKGRVIGDRYHARRLRTPTEVRNARHYLQQNHRKHLADVGKSLPLDWVDPYTRAGGLAPLPEPRTWLLIEGWRRARPRPG